MKRLCYSIIFPVTITAGLFFAGNVRVCAYQNVTVVIDPGHGGPGTVDETDTGANYNGILEKDINLKTALALRDELSQYGNVTVYMTREEDKSLTLAERVNIAAAYGADVLISVHHNASADHLFYGAEIFTASAGQNYATGHGLASCVMDEWTRNGAVSKGIKTRLGDHGDYYGIIRNGVNAGIPTIILEHGYIDNKRDLSLVGSDADCVRLGKLDAAGIARYYGLSKGLVKANVSPTVSVAVPDGIVYADLTPPSSCELKVDSYDANGEVSFTITALENESRVMYYAVTKGETGDIKNIELFGDGNSVSGKFSVGSGYEGPISARVYNNYELYTDSAPVMLKAIMTDENEDDSADETIEAAIDDGVAKDTPKDGDEYDDAGKALDTDNENSSEAISITISESSFTDDDDKGRDKGMLTSRSSSLTGLIIAGFVLVTVVTAWVVFLLIKNSGRGRRRRR